VAQEQVPAWSGLPQGSDEESRQCGQVFIRDVGNEHLVGGAGAFGIQHQAGLPQEVGTGAATPGQIGQPEIAAPKVVPVDRVQALGRIECHGQLAVGAGDGLGSQFPTARQDVLGIVIVMAHLGFQGGVEQDEFWTAPAAAPPACRW
jgi:hypothetical protein